MNVLLNRTRPLDLKTIPLFKLTASVVNTFKRDDVFDTCKALAEVDCLHLPFPVLFLEVPVNEMMDFCWSSKSVKRLTLDSIQVRLHGIEIHSTDDYTVNFNSRLQIRQQSGEVLIYDTMDQELISANTGHKIKTEGGFDFFARRVVPESAGLLMAALATSWVSKESTINKRAERGVGNGVFRGFDGKTIYLSRTVVSVTEERDATGRVVRPHMRRGHVHRYWTGPKHDRQLIKKFVEMTRVNAPPDFEVKPKNYSFKD